MSVKTRVLMVDDEPNVLSGYRRSIGRNYDLVTANSGRKGLDSLDKEGPFEVVVTDMRMPEMDGLEFLKQAKRKHPNTVYVMLTGNADQQTAINAINQGQIFRFLNKPCEAEILDHTIRACKAQYDLIHAEAELLSNTLSGSVKLLIEALVISDPVAAEAVRGVREGVNDVIQGLGITGEWRFPLAASLFMIGSITTPRTSSEQLYDKEYIESCSRAGAKLLRHISRLDLVAQIILHQRIKTDLPDDLKELDDESRVVVGSQILRFSYDWYCATRACNGDRVEGLGQLASVIGEHDRRLFIAASSTHGESEDKVSAAPERELVELEIGELYQGLLTDSDINTCDGSLLVAKGQVLSQLMIDRLRAFNKAGLVEGTATVWIEKENNKYRRASA